MSGDSEAAAFSAIEGFHEWNGSGSGSEGSGEVEGVADFLDLLGDSSDDDLALPPPASAEDDGDGEASGSGAVSTAPPPAPTLSAAGGNTFYKEEWEPAAKRDDGRAALLAAADAPLGQLLAELGLAPWQAPGRGLAGTTTDSHSQQFANLKPSAAGHDD
jgi:hypothetical protein